MGYFGLVLCSYPRAVGLEFFDDAFQYMRMNSGEWCEVTTVGWDFLSDKYLTDSYVESFGLDRLSDAH